MAYPIRHLDPNTTYFITSRTIQSRFLLAPTAKTNELLGGILARAVRLSGVELFAYVFTSNHYHLMARAPSAVALSRFMQLLQSNIAVKVGRLVGWRGRFFERRYSAEPIVDEGAQVERLGYILSHGVKEGLVAEVRQWPGLSSVHALLGGTLVSPQIWRNWTQRWNLETGEGIKIDRFSADCPSETESLTLTPLPCWSGLTTAERSKRVATLIGSIDAAARGEAQVPGPSRITAQDPHGRPQHTKRTPRPKAHASTLETWVAAVRSYQEVLAAFRDASRRWLAGFFDTEFPLHCFRPPTWGVIARIV
jgi:REP element-mobilizing transposase RayT